MGTCDFIAERKSQPLGNFWQGMKTSHLANISADMDGVAFLARMPYDF
jgi:hypothetical protein